MSLLPSSPPQAASTRMHIHRVMKVSFVPWCANGTADNKGRTTELDLFAGPGHLELREAERPQVIEQVTDRARGHVAVLADHELRPPVLRENLRQHRIE